MVLFGRFIVDSSSFAVRWHLFNHTLRPMVNYLRSIVSDGESLLKISIVLQTACDWLRFSKLDDVLNRRHSINISNGQTRAKIAYGKISGQ